MGIMGGVLIAMGLWKFWKWQALQALIFGLIYGIILGCYWEWSIKSAHKPKVQSGLVESQASERELARPLAMEVDFRDADVPPQTAHETIIETPSMIVVFEEYGAVIKRMVQKRMLDGKPGELVLWDINPFTERERGAFLLAQDKNTPLAYHLVSQNKVGNQHTIRFAVETDTCTIEKEFIIHSDTYQIDLIIELKNVSSELSTRILLPAPHLRELSTNDVINGIVCAQLQPLKKYRLTDVEGRAWERPSLFGTEDRYFITALVNDNNGFTSRAYIRPQGLQNATAILESKTITKAKSYTLSFYCGPKQRQEMLDVDSRLVGTLDYGWFTPVSTLLFSLLNFIYQIIGNYGWAILILTIILKLLMLPLSLRAEKTQKKMAEMQKKLQAIDRRHKDDKTRRDHERAELIKQHGFGSFLGLGLLPQLFRIVIFLGLNRVLSVAVELYRAPFIGWIHDLSAIDPFYILPAFVGLGTFITMRKATDARQIVTVIMMSMILTGIMINLAAGVVLYIAASTWLDIVQNSFQHKIKFA
jgi:YidC/Oxa1 family membrane protein insertase